MPRNRRNHRTGQLGPDQANILSENHPGRFHGGQCDAALSGAAMGCRCRIRCHRAHGAVRQRLLDMGLIPNAEVEVLRVATLGDPIELKVGDTLVTLRKHEAEQIEIKDY